MCSSPGVVNSISEPTETFICICGTLWTMRDLKSWEGWQDAAVIVKKRKWVPWQIDIPPKYLEWTFKQLVWEFRSANGCESQDRFTKNASFLVDLGYCLLVKECFTRGLSSFNRFFWMFLYATGEMKMEWWYSWADN